MKRTWMAWPAGAALVGAALIGVGGPVSGQAQQATPSPTFPLVTSTPTLGTSPTTGTPAPTRTASPTATPRTPGATATPGAGSSQAANLSSLQSYRFEFELRALDMLRLEVNGAQASNDRYQATCRGAIGGRAFYEEIVAIGDTTWVKADRNGQFRQGDPVFCARNLPQTLLEMLPLNEIDLAGARPVTVNGVPSQRIQGDQLTEQNATQLARALGLDPRTLVMLARNFAVDLDAAIARDGRYPVEARLDIGATSQSANQPTVTGTATPGATLPTATPAAGATTPNAGAANRIRDPFISLDWELRAINGNINIQQPN